MHGSGEILNFSSNLAPQSLQRPGEQTLKSRGRQKDIGLKSHILFYCSNMAGQCVQHVTKNPETKRSEAH